MYAKITKDHLYDGKTIGRNLTGVVLIAKKPRDDQPVPADAVEVRLYDDDEILYYEVLATDETFEWLVSWGARDSGVTILKTKQDGNWIHVIS